MTRVFLSVRPSVRPTVRTWENNAYSSRTNKDNLTKFYMQLYWLIPHTFYFMTFDLRGQIWPLRPKQKFQNRQSSVCGRTMHRIKKLRKITLLNFLCNFIGQFPTHFILWPLTSEVRFDLWGQNKNFKIINRQYVGEQCIQFKN